MWLGHLAAWGHVLKQDPSSSTCDSPQGHTCPPHTGPKPLSPALMELAGRPWLTGAALSPQAPWGKAIPCPPEGEDASLHVASSPSAPRTHPQASSCGSGTRGLLPSCWLLRSGGGDSQRAEARPSSGGHGRKGQRRGQEERPEPSRNSERKGPGQRSPREGVRLSSERRPRSRGSSGPSERSLPRPGLP